MKIFRNAQKSKDTIQYVYPSSLPSESEVPNPQECTQDHSVRDLGMLILKERRWVNTLNWYTSSFTDIPKYLNIFIDNFNTF